MRHPQNSCSGPAGHVTGTVTGRQESHRNELYHARVRDVTYSAFLSSLTTYKGRVCMFFMVFSGDSLYGYRIQRHFTFPLELTSGSLFATACELVSDNSVFRYISDFDLVKVGAKF